MKNQLYSQSLKSRAASATPWPIFRSAMPLFIACLLFAPCLFHAQTASRVSPKSAVAAVSDRRPAASATNLAQRARLIKGYGQLPLSFEANQGQTDPRVKFLSRGPGYTIFLTPDGAVLSLRSQKSGVRSQGKSGQLSVVSGHYCPVVEL